MEQKLHLVRVAGADGKIQEILIEGENENDATRRVRARGLVLIEFLGTRQSSSGSGGGSSRYGRRDFDVAEFTDRLVPLVEADIPLERALGIVEETAENGEEREIVSSLRRGLHEGKAFSKLIAGRRQFPRMYASIVEAGEEAGALPQVLAQLRTFLNMTREMRNFLISASIYPVVVMIVCIVVTVILLGFVVPKLSKVLVSTAAEPSTPMALLLGASALLKGYWWVVIVAAIALLWVIREISTNEGPLRLWWDRTVLRLPYLGRIVVLANIGRQVRTMSILMRSGVRLLDTVAISTRVLGNSCIRQSIAGLESGLRSGESLSTSLARSEYIPKLVLRMLAVGEETGNTAEMLERVADRYDDELRQSIKRALSWFEPAIILFLGVVVGGIVLILFLSIMDMQRNL
jgi:type II secretory pathway component PulF